MTVACFMIDVDPVTGGIGAVFFFDLPDTLNLNSGGRFIILVPRSGKRIYNLKTVNFLSVLQIFGVQNGTGSPSSKE